MERYNRAVFLGQSRNRSVKLTGFFAVITVSRNVTNLIKRRMRTDFFVALDIMATVNR